MEKHFELGKEEAQIINLMTEGYRKKEIAAKLGKSIQNVDTIIFRLRRHFQCRTSIQLVAKIMREFIYE